jgi:hypothetical protein
MTIAFFKLHVQSRLWYKEAVNTLRMGHCPDKLLIFQPGGENNRLGGGQRSYLGPGQAFKKISSRSPSLATRI